jgi:hypothetical protein
MTAVVDATRAPNGAKAKKGKPTTSPGNICACGCGLVFSVENLLVASVRSNPALQMRERLDMDAAKEYSKHYKRAKEGQLLEGETAFGLVQVVRLPDGTQVVADGFHRRTGMELANTEKNDFLVAAGTMRRAAHHAAKANLAAVQIRYTNKDKENACRKLWALLGNVSSHDVGKIAAVDHKTAQKYNPHKPLKDEDPPPPPPAPGRAGEIPQKSPPPAPNAKPPAGKPAHPVTPPKQESSSPSPATPAASGEIPQARPATASTKPAAQSAKAPTVVGNSGSKPAAPPPASPHAQSPASAPLDSTEKPPVKSLYTDLVTDGPQSFAIEPGHKRNFAIALMNIEIEIVGIKDGRASGFVRLLGGAA